MNVLCLPGDGIGPEVLRHAVRALSCIDARLGLGLRFEEGMIGGAALDATGHPLPEDTLERARAADALLLGAVGGPAWDAQPTERRPERGLLALRAALALFANLRPVQCRAALLSVAPLRESLLAGVDLLIVRELTGGIYFGEPRGSRTDERGVRSAYNTAVYDEGEIARVAEVAFQSARSRAKRLCLVDKANVLEVSALWREVVTEIAAGYPDVALECMYVDNAAMQLVQAPKRFDVVLTSNLFGDILSDLASVLAGSIGMLPSASLNGRFGLYEPCHGSAPDIAGQGRANPIAAMLSAAMLLRHSAHREDAACALEGAVDDALAEGWRTADIAVDDALAVGTDEMADAVLSALESRLSRRWP